MGNVFCKTVYTFMFVTYVTAFLEPNLFPEKGNIQEYLAKEVLNTTNFCLAGGKSVKDILTCLMGVASTPHAILNHTRLRDFHLTDSYSSIFDWGPPSDIKDQDMYTLHIAATTNSAMCFSLRGCHTLKVQECISLNNTDLRCNSTEIIPFSHSYMKLPPSPSWFILCGLRVYSYLPANSTGGPCILG